MRITVEILLAIGILVNVIKAADLILRPHQQKYLQNKFEAWTLRIEYLKPLDWYVYENVGNRAFWHVFVLLPAVLLSGALLAGIWLGELSLWWSAAPILYLIVALISVRLLKLPTRMQESAKVDT